jgi:Zn-dependent peptidase ImmA (M78 family)
MTHNRRSIIRDLRTIRPPRPFIDKNEALVVAEEQAHALLGFLDIAAPAVDVGLLTQLPRIRVVVDSDLHHRGLSGASGWQDGRWLIMINKKDSLTRRRFTLAHEFKHILDAPIEKRAYRNLGLDDEDRKAILEEVADCFAANLLMPRLFVVHALRSDIRDVHRLAALFMVSPVAMNRRLRDLGLAIQAPEGQDPVLRYFRKGSVSRPIRRREPVGVGHDGPSASVGSARPGAVGGPAIFQTPLVALAKADPVRRPVKLLVNSEAIHAGFRFIQRPLDWLVRRDGTGSLGSGSNLCVRPAGSGPIEAAESAMSISQ